MQLCKSLILVFLCFSVSAFSQIDSTLTITFDFNNGEIKDELAKKVLGEAGYEMNKKRFTQQQQAPPAQPSP